jgi:hypothetical protein
MAVESDLDRAQYATNGTTGPWTVPFYFLANTDLLVTYTAADGTQTQLTLNADYSVAGAGDPSGGTVTTINAYAAGGFITILRDMNFVQEVVYPENGPFPAKTHEGALDRLTMIAQQLREKLSRAVTFSPGDTVSSDLPPANVRAGYLLGFDGSGGLSIIAAAAQSATALALALLGSSGSTNVSYTAPGTGTVLRSLQDKLAERKSIADFTSLANAFANPNVSGPAGTGYGMPPVIIDLLGQTIALAGHTVVPTNVTLVNGTVTGSYCLIWRSPYIADHVTHASNDYWPYMTGGAQRCTFACRVIVSGYVGSPFGYWRDCVFTGLVLLNSDGLWTEANTFERCLFTTASDGTTIIFDGNTDGTSTWRAITGGSGAGTADGSFGYNLFLDCKIDASAGWDGIVVTGGGVAYNGVWGFVGYVRGAGNAFAHIVKGRVSVEFDGGFESFGAASLGLLIDDTPSAQLWYCSGRLRSASPQMRMSQGSTSDVRANTIDTVGFELQDSSGAVVFNGDGYPSEIRTHVSKRFSTSLSPVARVYKAANQTLPSNSDTVIIFDQNIADSNSYVSSNRFLPKVAGWYSVTVTATISATSTATGAYVSLLRNSTLLAKNDAGTVGASMTRTVSTLVYLNGTTNYIEAHAWMFDNAGAGALVAGPDSTQLTCVFVRPA